MRKIGSGRGMVSAYPRQLESLIRLAEAHSKVRFSEKVETIDVEEAKRLHREALKQSATDPRTGFVDISILTTGNLQGQLFRKCAAVLLAQVKYSITYFSADYLIVPSAHFRNECNCPQAQRGGGPST